jgi:hypothetical protein
MEFTEEEKEVIRRMKGMSHLYDKVCLYVFDLYIALLWSCICVSHSSCLDKHFSWPTRLHPQLLVIKKSSVVSY